MRDDTPTLRGRLEEQPLPEVVQQLFSSQSTGQLTVESRLGRHEVFVREGYPVCVLLPGSAELIGKVLLEMGYLTDERLQESLAQPPPVGKLYGAWLVERGLLSTEQLKLALKAQVRRRLHRLFFLESGRYAFVSTAHARGLEGGESLKIHPHRAIFQGVRSAWSVERILASASFSTGAAVRCLADTQALARFGFAPDELQLAGRLGEGWFSVASLLGGGGQQAVLAVLLALRVAELLEVQDAPQQPLAPPLAVPTTSAPLVPPHHAPTATNLIVRGLASPEARRATTTSPALGVPVSTLDASSASGRAAAGSGGVVAASSVAGRARPALSAAAEAAREELEAKLAAVAQADHFAVLELPSTATADQVKQAYLEQAKRFHPDRLPALGLDELRPVADQLFRKIGEAFAILSDTRRRAEYQLGLARPEVLQAQQAARTLVDAELAFRKGEALLNRGDLAGALVEFDQALAANPTEPDHIGAQLWARVCLQQVPVAAAKTKLNELTQSAPKSARCWYWLGLCYRELGDLPRAIAALIKARELDGRLVGLDSELRALQMRKEKSSPATGGLFSRLRKK